MVLDRFAERELQKGTFKFRAGTDFAVFLVKSEEEPDAADLYSTCSV
jgi:hypothetical protein